jgi:lipopolysaccharide transport system permease protein
MAEPIVIAPPGRWAAVNVRELWAYRELVYFMTKRELLVRYKQSGLGVLWAVLQPVALAMVFALFFGVLADIPSQSAPYPVFALVGLVPWMFFSQSVAGQAASLIGDANLLAKVYFPRFIIPMSKLAAYLADLLIALVVLVVVASAYGIYPDVRLLAVPGIILLVMVAALGLGSLLAAINVRYRDVAVGVPLLLQIWLFMTPIIYPGSLVMGAWKYVYALNPMVSVVEAMRWAFIGGPGPGLAALAISIGASLLMFCAGMLYFSRTQSYFADII